MNRFPLRIALVAMIAPFAIGMAAVALVLAWLPDLPDVVVIHWDVAGRPDGYGPAWSLAVVLAVAGVTIPAIFGTVLMRTIVPAGPTATQKVLAVASLFAVSLISIVVTASVAIQRGPGTATADIFPTLVLGIALSLALGGIGWFVLPRAVPGGATTEPVAPVSLAPGELVVWVGRARVSTAVTLGLWAVLALVTALIVFVIAVAGVWPLVIVPVVVGLSLLGTTSWKVRVDRAGLTVRAALGWPRYRIPLADIERASAARVVALGEFGGYGMRWGLGRRFGIITRSGEALEVVRRGGRTMVVTVDDAATAAGLLTALARP